MTEIDIAVRDRTQIIRFNRPDKKNALKRLSRFAIGTS